MKEYQLNIFSYKTKISKQLHLDKTKCRYVLYDNFEPIKITNSKYEMKIFLDLIGLKYTGKFRRYKFDPEHSVNNLIFQLDYEQRNGN